MRVALVIGYQSLLLTIRDRKAIISAIILPLALTLILGVALKGTLSAGKIEPFTVIVLNEDQPAQPSLPAGAPAAVAAQLPTLDFGKLFVTDVLGSEQARVIIITREMNDLAEARELVADGQAAAAVVIPATFTADALGGRPANLAVYTDPGQEIQAGIVTQIAQSYTAEITTQLLPNRLLSTRMQSLDRAAAAQLAADLAQKVTVQLNERSSGARSVSALQYYAAAMAIMNMLLTAIGRAGRLIEERENGTLQRMMSSPASRSAILAGQVLDAMVVPLAQFLVLLLGTSLVYGVYWGPWLPALLLGSAFALAAGGIGVAVAGLLSDRKAAESIGSLLGSVFAALSGAMSPLYTFPDLLKQIARFIPNYWALQGFLDQMAGMGTARLWMPLAVLAAIAVVSSGVGVARLATR